MVYYDCYDQLVFQPQVQECILYKQQFPKIFARLVVRSLISYWFCQLCHILDLLQGPKFAYIYIIIYIYICVCVSSIGFPTDRFSIGIWHITISVITGYDIMQGWYCEVDGLDGTGLSPGPMLSHGTALDQTISNLVVSLFQDMFYWFKTMQKLTLAAYRPISQFLCLAWTLSFCQLQNLDDWSSSQILKARPRWAYNN